MKVHGSATHEVRLGADMIAPAGHALTTLGNVIRGQAAQISELQAALIEARQQLAEQELGAAHEPFVDLGPDCAVVLPPVFVEF